MHSLNNAELESKQKIISNFLQSDPEKIYLVIGSEESTLYSFLETSISLAAAQEENLVLRYEIWDKEHSRHFLYRWLQETVSGQAFCGFGAWSERVNAEPHLKNQLQLLIAKDIRPLEIRFMEAVRFISAKISPEQRLILTIIPRTSLQDKVLVDFFRAMLRILPVHVKLLIGQDEQDVLVRQSDFCPSNRLVLDGRADPATAQIRERLRAACRSDDLQGRLIRIMAHTVHPVSLELLAKITGEAEDQLRQTLEAAERQTLVEHDGDHRFRLRHPRLVASLLSDRDASGSPDGGAVDRQAIEHFEERLEAETLHYPNTLFHSL
ncbi:MAG: hypothetical protein JSW39_09445, partial [Desulfobacterales bacterium]